MRKIPLFETYRAAFPINPEWSKYSHQCCHREICREMNAKREFIILSAEFPSFDYDVDLNQICLNLNSYLVFCVFLWKCYCSQEHCVNRICTNIGKVVRKQIWPHTYRWPCSFKNKRQLYLFTSSIDWKTILCSGNAFALFRLITWFLCAVQHWGVTVKQFVCH